MTEIDFAQIQRFFHALARDLSTKHSSYPHMLGYSCKQQNDAL